MFSSIGWGEIAVLIVAGLIILGPERLPGAVSWTMKSLRQVREYATGATDQLKNELGTDFEDLRKPLAELNELRGMTPRSIVTKHLLDGDDSVFRMASEATTFDRDSATPSVKPVSAPVPEPPAPHSSATHSSAPQSFAPDTSRLSPQPDRAPTSGVKRKRSVADWDAT